MSGLTPAPGYWLPIYWLWTCSHSPASRRQLGGISWDYSGYTHSDMKALKCDLQMFKRKYRELSPVTPVPVCLYAGMSSWVPGCEGRCGTGSSTSSANRQGPAAPALNCHYSHFYRARNDHLQSFHNHVKGIGVTISHLLPVFSLVLQKWKSLEGTFNKEKALVRASSVILNSSRRFVASSSHYCQLCIWNFNIQIKPATKHSDSGSDNQGECHQQQQDCYKEC